MANGPSKLMPDDHPMPAYAIALAAAGFTVMDTDAPLLKKAVRADVFIDLILVSMGSIRLTDTEGSSPPEASPSACSRRPTADP